MRNSNNKVYKLTSSMRVISVQRPKVVIWEKEKTHNISDFNIREDSNTQQHWTFSSLKQVHRWCLEESPCISRALITVGLLAKLLLVSENLGFTRLNFNILSVYSNQTLTMLFWRFTIDAKYKHIKSSFSLSSIVNSVWKTGVKPAKLS